MLVEHEQTLGDRAICKSSITPIAAGVRAAVIET
jgi:hypothetical protein